MGEIRQPPAVRGRQRLIPGPIWKDIAASGLPVLACFLGGATQKWAEGIVVGLLGLLLVLNPPRFSLGALFNLIALGFLVCAATGFLPAAWFRLPDWRSALVNDFALKLPSTLSPQPWLTAGCFLSLAAGMGWLYYVAGQDLENRAARRQLRFFAGGVVLLAALAINLYLGHTALTFWHNERGFGPFPNRNQTGNLLGIASVILLACGQEDIRQGKKRWILSLLGFAVLIAAIFLNFSRAGVVLLVAGSAIWMGVSVWRARTAAKLALGLSGVLVLLTVILVFGGATLDRFNLRGTSSWGVAQDFRWLIFRDTLALIRASDWCGIGLGNFEPVFAIFRNASLGQTRALHPESDWLWLYAELGWPAVALVTAGAILLVWRVFPLTDGTNARLRLAALLGAILFVGHGFADVSGHRVGTAFAGLFLFGLALRRPLPLPASPVLRNIFRFLGVLLLAVGSTWVIASARGKPLPGGIGVDREKQLATAANARRDFPEAIARANQGLKWAPLDWQLYFLRALGKTGAQRSSADALADFRRARFLEPNSYEVPYQEGVAWITRDPLLAMTAWREALRRAGDDRTNLYGRMLSVASQQSPALNRMLEDFGTVQPDLILTLLERATGSNFTAAITTFLERDGSLHTLSPAQKARLFSLWSARGDLTQLSDCVEKNPDLLSAAWPGLAKYQASYGDFKSAVELTKRFRERPKLPQSTSNESIEKLQKELYANPDSYAVGFALYDAQMRVGKVDDALVTLRRFTEQPNCPPFFHSLEADAWSAKGEWERAWNEWQAFATATGTIP